MHICVERTQVSQCTAVTDVTACLSMLSLVCALVCADLTVATATY